MSSTHQKLIWKQHVGMEKLSVLYRLRGLLKFSTRSTGLPSFGSLNMPGSSSRPKVCVCVGPIWVHASSVMAKKVLNSRVMVVAYWRHMCLISGNVHLGTRTTREGACSLPRHSGRSAGALLACFSLFQLIASHRILLNHPKPSEIHCAV